MSGKMLRWNCHYKSLYENIYCYFINQKMVDITLKCRDGEIKAHSIILCAGSSYFQNILNDVNIVNEKCMILERGISKRIMQYLLEFMYKGQVAVPNSDLKNVLNAATLYEIRGILVSNINDSFSTIQTTAKSTLKVSPSEEKNTSLASSPEIGHINSPHVKVSPPKNADVPTERPCSTSSPELGNTNSPNVKVSPLRDADVPTERHWSSSSLELGQMNPSIDKVSPPKDADVPTERHSSTSSPEVGHINSPTDKVFLSKEADVSTENHSSASSPDVAMKSSSVTSLLKKNPVALARNRISNARRDNIECRKEKRALKHGSRKWNDLDISDDSVKSISTLVMDTQKLCTSVQADDPDGDPVSDEEVEAVIQKSVSDTMNSTLLSQDLCKDFPLNSQKRCKPFLSTDDDDSYNEPLTKILKKKAVRVGKNVSKSSKTQNHCVGGTSRRKIQKYEALLLKSKCKDMDQLCVVCCKFHKDIAQHIKINHKIWPRQTYPCKKCKTEFYLDSFLKDNHKCVEK